jgi:hypothetical protein
MKGTGFLSVVTLVGSLTALRFQPAAAQYPREQDVATLDGILRAYYEVVSGPVGSSPDRARDESLHVPGARVGITQPGSDGKPTFETMTLGEFHDRFGEPRTVPFYEWELHRVTQRFGDIAHVWSTYVTSDAPDGAPRSRGINSIQLHFDGARWWIVGWIFDTERADNPIPAEFLPTHAGSR